MKKHLEAAQNMRCGLIGEKLGHSFSPQIHKHFASYEYDLYEIAQDKLGEFFENTDLTAFNVTIPYKKAVIPYLSGISDEARRIGAVNTVIRRPDGSFYGDNTDYYGFKKTVELSGIDVKGKKALVLGSGGAAATVKTVLADLLAKDVITVSRSGDVNYENVFTLHGDAEVIVNTTPVGMYPSTENAPIDVARFPSLCGVIDVIYNPARTKLLTDTEKLCAEHPERNIRYINGLYMLVAQAKRACELFLGDSLDDSVIPETVTAIRLESENLILIGMPSCGKSTVGKLLSKMAGRRFVDTDALIPEFSGGLTPAECITSLGVKKFRELETEAVKSVASESGLIIATGGGVPTITENYEPLHRNGFMIRIDRDVSKLSRHGRPLSIGKDLEELYRERLPFYEYFEDATVKSQDDPQDTANAVYEAFCALVRGK